MAYVSSRIFLPASTPTRVYQEATSFAIIAAQYPGTLQVSLDMGGYGDLPIGVSLDLQVESPLYIVSSVSQFVTVAYGSSGCRVIDSRVGASDANGNVLISQGLSPRKTFSVNFATSVAGGGATKMAFGLYGASRPVSLTAFVWTNAAIGAPGALSLIKFTGTPAASASVIRAMNGVDTTTAIPTDNQTGTYVKTATLMDIFTAPANTASFRLTALGVNGMSLPSCAVGEGLGFEFVGSTDSWCFGMQWVEG